MCMYIYVCIYHIRDGLGTVVRFFARWLRVSERILGDGVESVPRFAFGRLRFNFEPGNTIP